ncbi:TonB-dependent receptor plug domain-containing protein [Pigmentibacter ruber]
MKFITAAKVFLLPISVHAQNPAPIIVLPKSDQADSYKMQSAEKFKNSKEIIEDPSSGNINQEIIFTDSQPGTLPSPKSISDLTKRITSGQVEQFGGEAGALRVRLRGARAFEPTYYFNGLPLAGSDSSEQIVSLIPISAIASLMVYPDSPPFWLSSMGISGDINVLSCQKENCFAKKRTFDENSFKVNSRAGSFHYWQNSISHALQLDKNFSVFSTVEATSSKEDYPVFNNNNSVLNANRGQYENLQNNDFQKYSGYFHLNINSSLFNNINSATLYTDYEKGIPGAVSSASNARIRKKLFISTLQAEKFYPDNGIIWNNQLGLILNKSEISNFSEGYTTQANSSFNTTAQIKSWMTIPTQFIFEEKTGIVIEYLNFTQNTTASVPAALDNSSDSESKSLRREIRLGLFESIYLPLLKEYSLSLNFNSWLSGAQSEVSIDCNKGNLQNICNTKNNNIEKNIYGYSFSIQQNYKFIINYLRYILAMRRPYLAEMYGSPSGILANSALQEEQSRKIEFGFTFPYFEIGTFYTKDSNLIFLQEINQFISQYQNIEDSNRIGLYLNSDIYIYKSWKFYFSYQYVKSLMNKNNNEYYVPRSSENSINSGTSVDSIFITKLNEYSTYFGSYFNLNWQSEFYLDYLNINKVEIPPIYNTGFSVQFKNLKEQRNFLVSFDIYNIADETYAKVSNTTGFSQQMQTNGYIGYPPPGRRFYLTISGEI